MRSNSVFVLFSALAAYVDAHSVILAAQGEAGTPESVGFKVVPELARNCTNISPCQQDSTIIRDQEITDNIASPCGRTEIDGNINIAQEMQKAVAAKKVTGVKAGSVVTMTIHQVNADGAGPMFCDVAQNGNTAADFKKVNVVENMPGANGLSQAKFQQFQVKVQMPNDLNCAIDGDKCTLRCRNAALAGPFGGCVALQQTGKQAKQGNQGNKANKACANNKAVQQADADEDED